MSDVRCRLVAAERAARADLLVRIVAKVLDEARPPLASTVRTARTALDELREMVPTASLNRAHALSASVVERIARDAGLPEFDALDYRRNVGMAMTEPECCDWERIERFEGLVASAAVAAAPSNRTPGAGPVAAT